MLTFQSSSSVLLTARTRSCENITGQAGRGRNPLGTGWSRDPGTVIILRRMGSALRYAEPVPRAQGRAMRRDSLEFRQKAVFGHPTSQYGLHSKYKHPSRLCT
jgi:hypothetical protein